MGFVGETIEPDVATIDAHELASGEPAAPRAFVWRGTRYEIETIASTWKSYKPDRGEKYVDRHWFEVITTGGERMRLYFDRRPKTLKRWWLFSTGDQPALKERAAGALDRYLDERGRITVYPSKLSLRRVALAYLAGKFEPERRYREPEVNELLQEWHTFGDWALLRRELFDLGFLNRTADGTHYWRDRDVHQELSSAPP